MRWTKADDDAIRAAGAAHADTGTSISAAWQPDHCPDRGVVTADEAKWRFCRLGKRSRPKADEPASGAGLSGFLAVDATTKRTCMRATPMAERSAKVGVVFRSTPSDLKKS